MSKKFLFLFLLSFTSFLLLFCGSDSEKLNCKDICAKLKECEGDDETACNKFCTSMNEKNYFQDSYVKAINECPDKSNCDEFSKCGDDADNKCTLIDTSNLANTLCEKMINECKIDTGTTKDECIKDFQEGAKDNCTTKKYFDDFENCIKTISCDALKQKGSSYCQDKILGIE